MRFEIYSSRGVEPADIYVLSRKLTLNAELYLIEGGRRELLGFLSHKMLVFFAIEFADYALKNYAKKIIPEAQTCIDLTRKWLEDQSSVSTEQPRVANAAANANADYATANATYSAANAVYAAYYATNAAYHYVANAAYAICAAGYAGNNKELEMKRQGRFIIDFLKSDKGLFLL